MRLLSVIEKQIHFSMAAFGLAAGTPLCGQFVDATLEAGLVYEQMLENSPDDTVQLMSGGAAAGDFDGDGWVDIFVTRVGAPGILFRNQGPSGTKGVVRFHDVTSIAGVGGDYDSNGAAWADIDNDGDLDLFVTTLFHNRFYLYVNRGDGTFAEEAVARGADLGSSLPHNGFSVSFGDYDRDGYLDFHVCEWGVPVSVDNPTLHNALMRNRGKEAPGHFTNRTVQAGVSLKGAGSSSSAAGKQFTAFTSRFNDMDGDGWPDLLVAADYGASQLFWNNGDGTFVDLGTTSGVGLDRNGMGSDVGDYNGDGLLDWFVTSINDNRLYLNIGDRRFVEVASRSGPTPGLTNAGWGWGISFFDQDNDGDLDLVMANGHQDLDNPARVVESIDQTTFWRSNNGYFKKVSDEMGFDDTMPGKGVLTFDYDKDGDLDVFIVNCQAAPILYRNVTPTENHWLRIQLEGRKSNARGIGARIEVKTTGGKTLVREVSASSSFLSQSEATAHFGLGNDELAAEVTITWPSGRVQTLTDLLADQEIRIQEPATFDEWLERQSVGMIPGLGGKADDFDGDGFDNYTEYVFSTDPRDRLDMPAVDRFDPIIEASEVGLRIQYRIPVGAFDVRFVFEHSSDLVAWAPVGEDLAGFSASQSVDGGFDEAEIILPFDSEETPFFLRIRAVEPAD